MGIYFLGFEARPSQALEESKEFGGAYINCWIKADSDDEAQNVAYNFITSEGWIIEAVKWVPRLVTAPDKGTEERFEQAEIDGACYVFHYWPVGDRSEERLH